MYGCIGGEEDRDSRAADLDCMPNSLQQVLPTRLLKKIVIEHALRPFQTLHATPDNHSLPLILPVAFDFSCVVRAVGPHDTG